MHSQPLEINELLNISTNLENRQFDPCENTISIPKSKQQLCSLKARDFQSLLCNKKNKMSFSNQGGLFGLPTGVCWWHSQFHRNATYLTYFSPDKKKLDPDNKKDKRKLKKIIRNIAKRKKLVEIPGYNSIREFTADPQNEKLIQKYLQKWMAEDSLLKMSWINGLIIPNNYTTKSKEYYEDHKEENGNPFSNLLDSDSDEKAQKKLKRNTYKDKASEEKAKEKTLNHQQKEVDKLFENVSTKNEISFITLQFPSVEAHSQIVFDANKSIVDGQTVYDFKVQDSSSQGTKYENIFRDNSYSQIRYSDGIWYHRFDAGTMNAATYVPINIAVHNDHKLKRIQRVFKDECNKELFE